jgi:hypothetical protein
MAALAQFVILHINFLAKATYSCLKSLLSDGKVKRGLRQDRSAGKPQKS